MHPCLSNPEIATLIAEQGFYDTDRLSRKGILSLAQTCQHLYEPVTNVVWRRIPNLKPLTSCISEEIWPGEEEASSNISELPVRALTPQDLSRLRLNARRVRAYGADVGAGGEVFSKIRRDNLDPDALQILSLADAASVLLPCLREAYFHKLKTNVLPLLHFVLPHDITRLSIRISPKNNSRKDVFNYLSFLNSVGHRYPLLETFNLKISETDANITPVAVANVFTSAPWQNLSSLRVEGHDASYRVLLPFLHSENLRSISMSFSPDEHPSPELMQSTTSEVFPSLERIELIYGSIAQAVEFFDALHSQMPLRKIDIEAVMVTPLALMGLEDFSRCISSVVRTAEDLQDLIITERYLDHKELTAIYSLTLKDLKPLQRFAGLQTIKILCTGHCDLDDEDLRNLAMAWPKARNLMLIGVFDPQQPLRRATLAGLTHFARLCPELESLNIEVDARTCPTLSRLEHPARGLQLRDLDISMSHIGDSDPDEVAAFISDLFPNIKQVITQWEETGDGGITVEPQAAKAWKRVNKVVTIFARVRSEEVARCTDGAKSPDLRR